MPISLRFVDQMGATMSGHLIDFVASAVRRHPLISPAAGEEWRPKLLFTPLFGVHRHVSAAEVEEVASR